MDLERLTNVVQFVFSFQVFEVFNTEKIIAIDAFSFEIFLLQSGYKCFWFQQLYQTMLHSTYAGYFDFSCLIQSC